MIRNEGNDAGSGFNYHNNNKEFVKKKHFPGAHPVLSGFILETCSNHTNQIANFTTIEMWIHALLRQQFDPYTLESIEKM